MSDVPTPTDPETFDLATFARRWIAYVNTDRSHAYFSRIDRALADLERQRDEWRRLYEGQVATNKALKKAWMK